MNLQSPGDEVDEQNRSLSKDDGDDNENVP